MEKDFKKARKKGVDENCINPSGSYWVFQTINAFTSVYLFEALTIIITWLNFIPVTDYRQSNKLYHYY